MLLLNRPHGRIFLILFLFLFIPLVFPSLQHSVPFTDPDFPTFYSAAQVTFRDGRSPFSYEILTRAGARFGFPGPPPYLYPPPSLLLLYPFAFLSYEAARRAMLAANQLLTLLFIYIFFFKVMRWKWQEPFLALALVYTLTFHALGETLDHGQVNLLVLVLIAISWYALKEDRGPLWAALPLSLSIVIKLYPALLLLYLLLKRKYHVLLWTLALLGAYSLVAGILLPRAVWSDWLTRVVASGGYGQPTLYLFSPAAPWNFSLNGFAARLFLPNEYTPVLFPSPAAARIVPYCLAVLLLLALVGLGWLARRSPDRDGRIDLELSLWLATMFMVAPLSWEHHLVFVLPAVLVALYRLVYCRGDLGFLALVGLASLVIGWEAYVHFTTARSGWQVLLLSRKLYAVAALWLYCVYALWRSLPRVP